MSTTDAGRAAATRAFSAVAAARGQVRGKCFHLTPDTLACILLARGITVPGSHDVSNPHLRYLKLYGIPVVLEPDMRFGDVTLEER